MNRRMLLLVTSIWVLLLSAGCGGGEAPDLLVQGGFERQTELQKGPEGWYATVVPETKDFVSFDWDAEVAHSGESSVSIAIDPGHPEDKIAYNWTKTVPGCQAGKTYELSGWVKTENMTGPAWIVAQCWDEARSKMLGFATTQTGYPVTGTTDWTQVGTVFTVPDGTEEVRIRAGVMAPENAGGKVWYDDLHVREVS